METATVRQEATASQSMPKSSPEVARSWIAQELDRRHRIVLRQCGLPYVPLDIPYLDSPEGMALLNAEIRLHLHDQNVWTACPTLIHRHLLRAGLTARDAGAIVGRAGHTIHTGAHTYTSTIKSLLRSTDEHQLNHGFTNVSLADRMLITANMDHMAGQTRNRADVTVHLNERLFYS
jgi:hypothetical protein